MKYGHVQQILLNFSCFYSRKKKELENTPHQVLTLQCPQLWYLTLIEPGSGIRWVLTSLSWGVNLPFPVFYWCVIERYGFGNSPESVAPAVLLERPDWKPATPRLCTAWDWKLIADCKPQPGGTSLAPRFWCSFLKINIKCHFLRCVWSKKIFAICFCSEKFFL